MKMGKERLKGSHALILHKLFSGRWYWLVFGEMLLFSVCIGWAGWLYIPNAQNFGKPHPAYWGMAAIIAAAHYTLLARVQPEKAGQEGNMARVLES